MTLNPLKNLTAGLEVKNNNDDANIHNFLIDIYAGFAYMIHFYYFCFH